MINYKWIIKKYKEFGEYEIKPSEKRIGEYDLLKIIYVRPFFNFFVTYYFELIETGNKYYLEHLIHEARYDEFYKFKFSKNFKISILCKLGLHLPLRKHKYVFTDSVDSNKIYRVKCSCGINWLVNTKNKYEWFKIKSTIQY